MRSGRNQAVADSRKCLRRANGRRPVIAQKGRSAPRCKQIANPALEAVEQLAIQDFVFFPWAAGPVGVEGNPLDFEA
jgi:hypothetical protein